MRAAEKLHANSRIGRSRRSSAYRPVEKTRPEGVTTSPNFFSTSLCEFSLSEEHIWRSWDTVATTGQSTLSSVLEASFVSHFACQQVTIWSPFLNQNASLLYMCIWRGAEAALQDSQCIHIPGFMRAYIDLCRVRAPYFPSYSPEYI